MRRILPLAGFAVTALLVLRPPIAEARLTAADLEAAGLKAPGSSTPRGSTAPEALPDIFGPGAVLNVGNIHMKITNFGFNGNPFPALSSDPSGQWPGASGTEYVNFLALAVGGVNPLASDPAAKRRVSYATEWRPRTLDPEDRIYRAYDGIVNGTRLVNDDGDHFIDLADGLEYPVIDEDFLDGRDTDGDGQIDEDFGAIGQQMFSYIVWDNTFQAINSPFNEKHVPVGLECRQRAWAYSIRGFQDFNVFEYEIFNRSGHDLDSVCVAFLIDMDAGPTAIANFFQDDLDLPQYPSGIFPVRVGETLPNPLLAQHPHAIVGDASGDSALCGTYELRINGFSTSDDNGDENRTTGIPSFLLVEHSTDPLGLRGPKKVGFRAFRSFTAGSPYQQGGNPIIDHQRFEFMTSIQNVDVDESSVHAGLVRRDLTPGDTRGDYQQWVSLGSPIGVQEPGSSSGLWKLGNNESIHCTIAFAVKDGSYDMATGYNQDYDRYIAGTLSGGDLLSRYPSLANAFALQIAYEGVHVLRQEGFILNDFHGRETRIRRPLGAPDSTYTEDCPGREPRQVIVNSRTWSWFDFDCNYCTGPWDYTAGRNEAVQGGLFQRTWNAAAPPPNPLLNTSTGYNYSDNPNRTVVPAGDKQVVVAWDNLSEVTADPKSQCFDFRGYRLWKVSDWTRPVGAAGPAEADWKLLGEFRLFDYEDPQQVPIARNYSIDPVTGEKRCPLVFVPNYEWTDSTNTPQIGKHLPICLDRGDLWDRQSGTILRPDTTLDCISDDSRPDGCSSSIGGIVHRQAANDPCKQPANQQRRVYYPVGRYRYVDQEVKNGFVYFYSVTAFDSTFENSVTVELEGRRSAVESEAVAPQAATRTGNGVWVVPNPYRGYSRISERPSSWDLTPNAGDPTGTHIDFMGLPPGAWTIRVFTVSGDLVAELHSTDPVNESLRAPQTLPGTTTTVPGYNRQQDSPNDGQARWNLISRNGQDIVSGIYLFTVDSAQGPQRGKFIVIR